jgi:hypothetical protein
MGKLTEKLEKVLPWSIVGVVASIVLGLPALYFALHIRAPQVTFTIESIAHVFDLHRPLPELIVLFKGDNIQDQGKNLQIVTVTLRNNGEQNVLQGDYDQLQPFGLHFPNARIIGSPRVIHADSDYLTKNLMPRTTAENTVELNKVILERDRSATIEIVILHEQASVPILEPFGKVAGQDHIILVDRRSAGEPSFWRTVFVGGLLTNIVRFFCSVIILVVFITLLLGTDKWISGARIRRSSRRARKYLAPFLDNCDEAT